MKSPEEAVPNPHLERLSRLRDRLIALHKTLVDSERATYEQAFGKVENQNRFLQLLINDPWFAWLHQLSELVVAIDEMIDGKPPLGAPEATQISAQVRGLLKVSEEGHDFGRSYFEALQRDPDVVLAHAEVVKQLNASAP